MHITFYGAAREVTGSFHVLTTEKDRIAFDCGLFQGRRKESQEKNRILPFDPRMLTTLLLSHAHIDHSGRIPLVMKNGFSGRIVCTRATADAAGYLLLDSAQIQQSDAEYFNYKTVRSFLTEMKNQQKEKQDRRIKRLLKKSRAQLNLEVIQDTIRHYHLEHVEPLYTVEDAQQALPHFEGYPYRHEIPVAEDAVCTLYDAGHILGSAFCILRIRENGRLRTVGYTGDIGRFGKPILKNPTLEFADADRDLDWLIMESTYGDREHHPVADLKPDLGKIIAETARRGGVLLIPSFAFGRTQELLYVIHDLFDAKEAPRIPVYLDSPLAVELTRVYGEHPEVYDRQSHEDFLSQGKNPFSFSSLEFVVSVEDSMKLMRKKGPHIVIAGSGMCEGGRILHHLRHKIQNPKNTILIVGFMAANTLGRRILELGEDYAQRGRQGEVPQVKFYNNTFDLKARVISLGGFSAHADKNEMLRFLKNTNLRVQRIAVVHGEEEQALAFAGTLKEEGYTVRVPRMGETIFFAS